MSLETQNLCYCLHLVLPHLSRTRLKMSLMTAAEYSIPQLRDLIFDDNVTIPNSVCTHESYTNVAVSLGLGRSRALALLEKHSEPQKNKEIKKQRDGRNAGRKTQVVRVGVRGDGSGEDERGAERARR